MSEGCGPGGGAQPEPSRESTWPSDVPRPKTSVRSPSSSRISFSDRAAPVENPAVCPTLPLGRCRLVRTSCFLSLSEVHAMGIPGASPTKLTSQKQGAARLTLVRQFCCFGGLHFASVRQPSPRSVPIRYLNVIFRAQPRFLQGT